MRGLGETSVVCCGVLEGVWESWLVSFKEFLLFKFFYCSKVSSLFFIIFFFVIFSFSYLYYNIQGVGVLYVRHYLNRAEKICREEDGNDWYEVEAVQNAIG